MNNESYRARITRFENGTTVVEPYRKTGSHRYEYMLQTKHTQLRSTKKDYIVVFKFPREKGILAATRQLISETARLSILMCNLYFHHNVQ
jgi:hypothetical protein